MEKASALIDIGSMSTGLVQGEDGIWYSRGRSFVSCPEEGNKHCYPVEDQSFWFQHRNRCIKAVLRAFPPKGTIFDIGGGNGVVAAAMEEEGHPTVMIEPGRQGAATARRERHLPLVICSALEDAGFREASFPAAGLFDVLEHLEFDNAFLESINGLLAPGARLYLTVPAYPALWSDVDVYAGHFRRYTLASLSRLLLSAGLEVEYATYFMRPLPVPIFFLRTLASPFRSGFRANAESVQRAHGAGSSVYGKLANVLFRGEPGNIKKGRQMPFGAACLAVARKSRA